MKKRWLSVLLVLCMVLTLLPFSAFAGTNGHTQSEAVSWAKSKVGQSLDYDNAYGAQCVDLIAYYYSYLGQASYVRGNGCDYASNALPSGWQRITYSSSVTPQPGDVAVWTVSDSGNTNGHVAIVISSFSGGFTAIDQNWSGQYCEEVNHYYNRAGTIACYIRPDFTTITPNVSVSNLGFSLNDVALGAFPDTIVTNEDIEFTGKLSANGTITWAWMGVCNGGTWDHVIETDANPMSNSYDISKLSKNLDIGSLSVGKYTLRLEAISGNQYFTVYTKDFEVVAPSASYSGTELPDGFPKGHSYDLDGTITANGMITDVEMDLYRKYGDSWSKENFRMEYPMAYQFSTLEAFRELGISQLDVGRYRIDIYAHCGDTWIQVYTQEFSILEPEATITQHPSDVTVLAGDTAVFKVSMKSYVTCHWQYLVPGGTWTDCTSKTDGAGTHAIYVNATAARDGYQYRCVVTGYSGNKVTSKAATLHVTAIKSQPTATTVAGGGTATFKVAATGDGLKYQWQFKKPDGSWTNCTSKTTGYNKATLKVEGVTGSTNRNGYQYRCKVTDSAGNTVTSSAATLTVKVLKITTQPKAANVKTSAYATFTVKATGDGLKYQWQYKKPDGSWANCTSKTQGYNTATLKVQGVTGSTNRNGYQYRCKVTDSAGSTVTSNAVKLNVLAITTQPKAASVAKTGTATFKVVATGSSLKYQWQFKTPSGDWKNCTSATTGYNTATLKVKGASGSTNRNGYQYRCIVTDGAGNKLTTSAVKLTVK